MTFGTDDCGCEPDLTNGLYARQCDYCGTTSTSGHCVHYAHPDPCPECDVVPVPQFTH